MALWILVIVVVLSVWTDLAVAFSSGAPLNACNGQMVPRHGFEGQSGDPPIQLVTDQYSMFSHQYLRVTIRSKRAFKGFLIRASSGSVTHLGTWYIPYLEDTSYLSESSYLHCGGRIQSAVTHSGRTNTMFVLSLQWKPPADFHGQVSFQATVVENYRVFWLDVLSSTVYVTNSDSEKHGPEHHEVEDKVLSTKKTSFYNEPMNQSEVNNTKPMIQENPTISSILEKDKWDLSEQKYVYNQASFIDNKEKDKHIDHEINVEHERHRANDKFNFDLQNQKVNKFAVKKDSVNLTNETIEETTKIYSEAVVITKSTKESSITPAITSSSIPSMLPSISTAIPLVTNTLSAVTSSKSSVSPINLVATFSESSLASKNLIVTSTISSSSINISEFSSNAYKASSIPSTVRTTLTEVQESSTEELSHIKESTTNKLTATTAIPSVQTESSAADNKKAKNAQKNTTRKTFAMTARKSPRSPRPRIIEPTFIFTTNSPTRKSRDIYTATSSTIINQKYSHFFNLSEEFEIAKDYTEVQSDEQNETDIYMDLSSFNKSMQNTLLYTFKESDEKENKTEDMTEVIIISNFTELERIPRDNYDQSGEEFARLDGPYQRLQAQYGGWENSGSKLKTCAEIMMLIVVILFL